jgi:hypothetical protein
MTDVIVNWEEADGVWVLIKRHIKDNQIKISRKRKVSTNTKYKFGLPGLGIRRPQFEENNVATDTPTYMKLLATIPEGQMTEDDVKSSLDIDKAIEKASLQEDEDCRPRQIKMKSWAGRWFGLPRYTLLPFYNASYKSHKTLPWSKNTIIPMDPKLYSEMSKNDTAFELLKRDLGMAGLLYFILGSMIGAFGMYTMYPMVNHYLNPPAANATAILSNSTITVVKGAIGLWIIPNLRRLKRR